MNERDGGHHEMQPVSPKIATLYAAWQSHAAITASW